MTVMNTQVHAAPLKKTSSEERGAALAPSEEFYVYSSATVFALCWSGVLVLHMLCLGFYATWGFLYVKMYQVDIGLTLQTYGFALRQSDFPSVAALYLLFSIPHACHALWMIACSMYYRTLVFGSTSTAPSPQSRVMSSQVMPSAITLLPQPTRMRWLTRRLQRVYAALFRRDGLFGIASKHFYIVLLALEGFEVVLQTIQAYRITKWTSRERLSRAYTVLIAINCWSTWLIQRLVRHDLGKQRLLCRAWDMLMDFASTVLLPVAIAAPYIQMYDPAEKSLDYELFYDKFKLINALNEFRILAVASWLDAASMVCFSLLLLDCLSTIKSFIRPIVVSSDHISARHLSLSLHDVNTAVFTKERLLQRSVRWCHRLFIGWGIAIIATQIHAEARATPPGCLHPVRPWFETRTICSYMRVHCERMGLTGNREELRQLVSNMVPEMVLIAEFRHCPALEITKDLHAFHNLIGLKIYKSNVVKWDDEAQVADAFLPELSFVYIILTQLPNDELPLALHSTLLPAKLTDFAFPGTRLSSLPDNLDEIWTDRLALTLDNNSFTHVPDVVTRLNIPFLSFVNNQLTTLPATLLSGSVALSFWLNGNPIQELPLAVTPSGSFVRLILQRSNISSLPPWILDYLNKDDSIVLLAKTPLCDRIQESLASADNTAAALAWLGDAAPFVELGGIDCAADEGDMYTYYPFDLEASFDN